MAKASLLKSPSTLKVRNRWPLISTSLMKSTDQHTLAATGTANFSGCRDGSRFLPFRRRFRFSAQYSRYTRLWFQLGCCLRTSGKSLPKPYRGNCSARPMSVSMTKSSPDELGR